MARNKKITKKMKFRITGISGILLGLGVFILFSNPRGWIPLVIGIAILIAGEK